MIQTIEQQQKVSELLDINEDKTICDCHCHQEGAMVMHCVPCCGLTYEKYIKSNGEIDIGKYELLKVKSNDYQI